MSEAADKTTRKDYNLWNNRCTNNVNEALKAGGHILKGLGTAIAVLTDYMSPNFGGRRSENPLKYAIDEKLGLKDYRIEEKTIEETGIKRFLKIIINMVN